MTHSPADVSRLSVRITAHRTLQIWAEVAAGLDLDLFQMLVFTGIWTANTEHLNTLGDRYAALLDLPPDSQRRPISRVALATRLRAPHGFCDLVIEELIKRNLVEERAAGLVVPTAVFTRPAMLQGLQNAYALLRELLSAMAEIEDRAG